MGEVSEKERYIFEEMPAAKAVWSLALPAVISQLVTTIYNLADTFFIGMLDDPYMTAAVSLSFPLFYIITSIGNLFGVGGASVISRLLGKGQASEIKKVSCFAFYGSAVFGGIYSSLLLFLKRPILILLGASENTLSLAESYVFGVIVVGGIPTAISLTMGNILRSDGHSKEAGFGMMLGGILNCILDPILISGLHLAVTGAAIATVISNTISMAYFTVTFLRMERTKKTALSIRPRNFTVRYTGNIFSVGICSALTTMLAGAGTMIIVSLSSNYGDIPVAAFGIVKKADMLPININMGLCQGYMPLVGYNYAAGNYERMKKITRFTWGCGLVFSFGCVAVSQIFAPDIIRLFIRSSETELLRQTFLKIASLAVPFTCVNFLISYAMQAMGKARPSFVVSLVRLGVLNIPLLFIMEHCFGMYGIIWTQLVTELIALVISFCVYRKVSRHL